MSDKKRKSTSKDSERPSKKQQTGSSVHVKHVAGPDVAKPVVACSPGVAFPDVKFQSFAKAEGVRTKLLLHSSDHPTLDHIAREDDNSIESHFKHYVAVFDPNTGKLQVTEAKRLTVRSALRSHAQTRQDDEGPTAPVTNYTSRSALTEAFGTKKSKKAVQSINENRLLAQGNEEADNTISTAILSKFAEDDDIDNQISLADALSNKPLPPANLAATEIDQVYSLDTLIRPGPANTTLDAMPINPWIARLSAKKDVKTRSRFVAYRVGYLAQPLLDPTGASDYRDRQALQLLRYIQLLIEIHTYVARLNKRRPIPRPDEWPENTLSEGTPMSLVRPISNHFFPDHVPKEPSVTLLRTTILALTLHVRPPTAAGENRLITEPTDISMDLAVETDAIRKLYRELGCTTGSVNDTELKNLGLDKVAKRRKDEAGNALPKPIFVKLNFPLNFPKLSRGRQSARR